jgi:hypothetical protein
MASLRIILATLFPLIASAFDVQAQWNYRTTENGEYRVGTNGRHVRVETSSTSIAFTVPEGWRISEPKSDETGFRFTAGSASDPLSLSFAIHRKLSADLLDPEFLRHAPHLTWPASEEGHFRLPDGRRLIPYYDAGDIRLGRYATLGSRAVLYLYLDEGEYVCAFEFSGSRLLGLAPSRKGVQKILDTYESTWRKGSDKAVKL